LNLEKSDPVNLEYFSISRQIRIKEAALKREQDEKIVPGWKTQFKQQIQLLNERLQELKIRRYLNIGYYYYAHGEFYGQEKFLFNN
jgi:hypothetical protein